MGSDVVIRLAVEQAEALAWIYEAASKDEARRTITGINFEWAINDDGALELIAVATDSYMLATRTLTFPEGTFEALPSEGSVLIEGKPFMEALKSTVKAGKKQVLPEMQATIVQFEDHGASIAAADGSEFKVVKAIDGQFPKWRKLMPTNAKKLGAISPALMQRATKLAGQPLSKLKGEKAMPFRVSTETDTLKPWLFTIPDGSQSLGTLEVLVMPVRVDDN